MMEPPVRAEAASVAPRRGDCTVVDRDRPDLRARGARVGDREAPGAALGGRAPDDDVPAEIDEPTLEVEPRLAHRPQGARGSKPLADAAEVDGGTSLETSSPGGCVDLDFCSRAPPARADGRFLLQLLERAVVAGGREYREDGRVESPTGLLTRPQRDAQRLDEPVVDRAPLTARTVQAR